MFKIVKLITVSLIKIHGVLMNFINFCYLDPDPEGQNYMDPVDPDPHLCIFRIYANTWSRNYRIFGLYTTRTEKASKEVNIIFLNRDGWGAVK